MRASPCITFSEKKFFAVNFTGKAAEKNIGAKRIVPMLEIDGENFERRTAHEICSPSFQFDKIGYPLGRIINIGWFHFCSSTSLAQVKDVSLKSNFAFSPSGLSNPEP
jgi:hypothetical protein